MKYPLGVMGSFLILLVLNSWSLAQERPGIPEHGAEVYKKHCQICHGANGEGDGQKAQSLIVKPTNFHSPSSRSKTDLELLSIVVWGMVYSPMHGYWDRLSGEEMRDVVSYIRKIAPYALYSPFPQQF